MLLNRDLFHYNNVGKGDNPKIFNFRFWQICQLYSNVWTPGKLFLQFDVGSMNFL